MTALRWALVVLGGMWALAVSLLAAVLWAAISIDRDCDHDLTPAAHDRELIAGEWMHRTDCWCHWWEPTARADQLGWLGEVAD